MLTAEWLDHMDRQWSFGFNIRRFYTFSAEVKVEYGQRTWSLTFSAPFRWPRWPQTNTEIVPKYTSRRISWLGFSAHYWAWRGHRMEPTAEELAEKAANEYSEDDLRNILAAATVAQTQSPECTQEHPNYADLMTVYTKMLRHAPFYGRDPRYWSQP